MKRVPGEEQYVVTAPLIIVRVAPDGHSEHIYRHGRVPPGVQRDQLAHLLGAGLIAPLHPTPEGEDQ